MIKLTRGALTMLLAQYRGILKNAWIKNFAVAAALATSVTSAYAEEPAQVGTWKDAVKEGAVALDGKAGVLNIQTSAEWKENPGTITITGGKEHKIGGKEKTDVVIFAEKENSEKAPVGSIVINTIGDGATPAMLTIANNQTEGTKSKTGVRIYSAEVKASSDNSKPTANLTVNTMPNNGPDYKDDEEQYVNIEKLTVDGKNASVNVHGELDVNELLTIKNGAKVDSTGILWMGNSGDGDVTSVNVEDGTLTSTGTIVLDSKKLKVGDKGQVKVSGNLNLADVGPVNIYKLTDVGEGKEGKITLTVNTDVSANTLVLDAKKNEVKSVTAADLTLGSDKYDNSGLAVNATVTTKLTAKVADSEKNPQAYKINNNESITLNTEAESIGLDISNEGNGTVASDLEVAGGNLNVQAGEWTAKNITVSAGALNVNGKSLAADGLTVKEDGTATVAKNAALALKSLEIANGKTLTVAAGDAGQNNAGVLDLTNTKLVNATGKDASEIKGTIANAGVVKITGEKLQGAIANVSDAEEKNNLGYIFNNTGVIEVAGPTALATGAFLNSAGTAPGIKNAGTLAVDGALTVKGNENGESTLANAGTIKAASLTLNGKAYSDAKDANNEGSVFTLADGEYDIAGAVTTDTQKLEIAGDVKAKSIGAHILEITGNVGADAIKADTIDFSGTVNAGNVEATKDLTVTAGATTVEGVLTAAKLTQKDGTITVKKGALNVTGDANVEKGTTTLNGATANIGTLKATTEGHLVLTNASTATVGSFDGSGADKDTVTIGEGSTLTITANQTAESEKAIFKNNASGDAITGKGTLAVNAGALGLLKVDTGVVYSAENKFANDTIGVLKINGADSVIGADKINNDNLDKLITALTASGSEKFNGKLQLVGVTADISGAHVNKDGNATDGSLNYGEVKALAQLAGDTTLESQTIKVDTGAVSGDVGNLVAANSSSPVSIGDATLQGSGSSTATNGYYVSAVKGATDALKNQVVALGAKLGDGSSLTLAGQGKIGAVEAEDNGNGTLAVTGNANVVKLDTEGKKEVLADIGANGKALAEVNVSGALTAADIYTNALASSGSVVAANIATGSATIDGGSVSAKTFKTLTAGDESTIKAGSVNVGEAVFAGALKMDGGALTATAVDGASGKVTLKAASEIKAGSITAKDLVAEKALTSAGNITVGTLTASEAVKLTGGVVKADTVTLIGVGDTKIIGNASLIAGDLTATGKTITVGEDGDKGSAGFLFAKNIKGAGKIVIDPEFSQGVALGGTTAFADSNELTTDIIVGKNAIFAYDENLTAEQLKSLTSKYNLSDAANGIGSLLVVNSAIDLAGHDIKVGKYQTAPSTPAPATGTLVLGQNAALAVGGTALANAKVNANNTQEAAVTANAGVQYADSAKVLLDGPVKAGAQYQIFKAGANGVKNADAASDKKLTASSLNGFYTATINEDGKTTKVNANRGVMYQMTEPLYQHMLAVTGNGNTGAGVQFLEKTASEARDGGKDAETVARLGAFGGLYNAAFNVNKSSTDAIAARMTMGNNGVQQVATNNTVGGAVWLSPVYKNVKADTFESDGKESGADVKLTGIALGGDVTTSNNIRLGVMFNLGSGDTDGNNLGSSVENDFDYYGFGAYAGYSFGNFAVAADATYAKVDNDLSAVSGTGYGYFKSSVDTNVYSLGLTAKYAFNTDFATITPHLGVRYTSLNADSYDVQSSYGVLATTSYDSAKVVSFPAGVTLTRDIKLNAWKLQPTFDVTLTANTGDTEATYNTYFTGANSKVKLESEFADSFTYGLAAGIEAQHENGLALGLGVTYEGSSNTNSYGVTGNVRYTF